jgi:hypothetical protein
LLESGKTAGAGGRGKPDALRKFDMRAAGIRCHFPEKRNVESIQRVHDSCMNYDLYA